MRIVKKENKDQLKFDEVEIREALTGDLIQAERIAGNADSVAFMAALLSQICVFDGKKIPAEEINKLSTEDLTALGNAAVPTPVVVGDKQP